MNDYPSFQSAGLLKGQVGLITGAGTAYGIGRECVKKFAAAGAKAIYACDLNINAIPSLQEECQKAGYASVIEGRVLDVSSEEQTLAIIKEIVKHYGRFDFYVANAGFANYRLGCPCCIQPPFFLTDSCFQTHQRYRARPL